MATIKDLTRMCKKTKCKDCPFSNGKGDNCLVYTTDILLGNTLVYLTPDCFPDNADEIVDKWVEEHPDDCRVEKNIMTGLKPCPFLWRKT